METLLADHHTPTELEELERLNPQVVRNLSKLIPWRSLSHVALEYIFIFGAIVGVTMYWHPLLYIFVVMWIAARQHAFAILMHDASHYRITKNRTLNDFIGEIFLAFPLFVTVRSYRLSHLAHHRHMNTEHDPDWVSKETPDWVFPKSRKELCLMLLRIAAGANIVWMIKLIFSGGRSASFNNESTKSALPDRWFVPMRIGYYMLLAGLLTWFGLWPEFLMFWLVPMFTWLQVILRIRSIAEHFGLDYDHTYTNARTTYPKLIDRIFLVSKNVWFHLDHHLYPSIPFYNLPALHQELNKLPSFKEKAHITRGYLGVLKECTPAS